MKKKKEQNFILVKIGKQTALCSFHENVSVAAADSHNRLSDLKLCLEPEPLSKLWSVLNDEAKQLSSVEGLLPFTTKEVILRGIFMLCLHFY